MLQDLENLRTALSGREIDWAVLPGKANAQLPDITVELVNTSRSLSFIGAGSVLHIDCLWLFSDVNFEGALGRCFARYTREGFTLNHDL